MSKEHIKLLDLVNDFDDYLCKNFDPSNPKSLYGEDYSDERKKFEAYAKEIYEQTEKCGAFNTDGEIDVRNRALVQLQLIKITDDVRKVYFETPKNIPQEGTIERDELNEKIKARDDAMLKYTCALSGVQKNEPHVSGKIDLDLITWVQSSDVETIQKSLNNKGVDEILKVDPSSPMFELKNHCFGKNSLASYTHLVKNPSGQGYSIDTVKTGQSLLEGLLSDSRMQTMITSFTKAEKYWLTSAMSATQEVENRLRFVNTYETELKSLYFALSNDNTKNPEYQKGLMSVLEKYGIEELVKDYRTFKDPQSTKTEYLMSNQNDFSKEFRKGYQEVNERIGKDLPKNEKLLEFHSYLLKQADYGTGALSEYRGSCGSVRPFLENFMGMPEKDQLKSLYMLENKMYKFNKDIPQEELDAYQPNLKNIDKVLRATPVKFWKRIDSSYMYWGKLKTCMDKAQGAKIPDREKKSVSKLKIAKIATKVTSLICKIKGVFKPALALGATSAILGSAAAIADIKKNAQYTTGAQKVGAVVDQVASVASDASMTGIVMGMKTLNVAAMKIGGGLGIASNTIKTGKSIASLVTNKKRVAKVADLDKEIKVMLEDRSITDEQRETLKKLETNTKVLKVINRDKVKVARADTIKNATALSSSALMATGVGVISLVPSAIASVGTTIYKNKVKRQDVKDVLDAKLYVDEADKQKQIDDAKARIDLKYARLTESQQKKYAPTVSKITKDKNQIADKLREESIRTTGQTDVYAVKNMLIHEISSDIFKLLETGAMRTQQNLPQTEFDIKVQNLANKFIEAAGGKEIDVTTLNYRFEGSEEVKQNTINHLAKNMSL